jgi:multiple sugar transport system substrate-binding protein
MRLTRRHFLSTAGAAGLAATGGWLRIPPAAAAAGATIRLVAHSSYNEDSDKAIAKIGAAFAAKHNATFTGEFIDQPQVAAKITAEEQARAGHDIVDLQDNLPAIHKNYLVPLDDVVADITKQFGPFYQVAKNSGYVDGHWLSLPWLGNSELAVYRSDYFAQAGEGVPNNWDDLLRAAPKLKKTGHPVGIAISSTEDSNAALYPLLWSFGGSITDTAGRLSIDSPGTHAAIDYVRKLASYMDPAVYSWDDSSNNKDILSGHGSYTINAPSIYLTAKQQKLPFAASVKHAQPPAGVKGRFFYVDIHGWGIMKFSKNITLAKQLLRSMYTADSQKVFLTLGEGYDMPVLPHFDQNPPYASDPQLRPQLNYMPHAHLASYPAPPDARAEKAYQTFVLPNMFARAAQGASNKDAIAFAVKALKDIGYA